MTLEEVPRRDQRHTVGVSTTMGRMLRRVARAVVFYRERHPRRQYVEYISFNF
jgi:hypothetical protein